MSEIREYDYPHKEDNLKLLELVKNASGEDIPETNRERGENCHITEDWDVDSFVEPDISKFVKWIEEVTDSVLWNIWGVLYYNEGEINWHNHQATMGITHSFAYYVNVPDKSSSIWFSRDPTREYMCMEYPITQGHCLVWEHDILHCVPPSEHNGRCVLSGNLK